MTNPKSNRRVHRLQSDEVLPLFDTLFGVALTLLAYSVPDHLMNAMDAQKLGILFGIYILTGAIVILYWYKLRRLICETRELSPIQLSLGMMSVLLIVIMPKLTQLVATQGGGSGDFNNWTPSQIINTIFIFYLALLDGLCLAYGRSLHNHSFVRYHHKTRITTGSKIKIAGFALITGLGLAELLTDQFNNQYLLIVPIILLAEEFILAYALKKG